MEIEIQHSTGKDLLSNAFENSLMVYKQQFNTCSEAFSEQAVHDFRVGIRRFSAVLSLTGHIIASDKIQLLKQELKPQIKAFNPLRDLQVQVLRIISMVYTHPVLYHYYHNLLYREEKLIQALDHIIKSFNTNQILEQIEECKTEINSFIKDNPVSTKQFFENVFEKYNNVILKFQNASRDDPATIHKVRLAFKKFRYSMEILQPISGLTEEDFLLMKAFQTTMGKIQDNVVFYSKLKDFIESQQDVSPELFIPVENAILDERKNLIDEFFNTFDNIKSFWKPEYLK